MNFNFCRWWGIRKSTEFWSSSLDITTTNYGRAGCPSHARDFWYTGGKCRLNWILVTVICMPKKKQIYQRLNHKPQITFYILYWLKCLFMITIREIQVVKIQKKATLQTWRNTRVKHVEFKSVSTSVNVIWKLPHKAYSYMTLSQWGDLILFIIY